MFVSGQAFGRELKSVADGVYFYDGDFDDSPQNSYAANAGVVVGDDGILVVDTLISAKAADGFIEDIRKVSDKPIKYVVNTHGHLDHSFGNSEFKKLGAVIVAHTDCRDYIEKNGEAVLKTVGVYGLSETDVAGTEIAIPTITFTDKMSIDLGGRVVELIYTEPSHVPGSIVVLVPEEKVLFTGDVLFTDFHPFLGEGDLDGWQKALDRVKALDATVIIPGHGPVSGNKDVDAMKEYLKVFDKRARELCAESDDIEYIKAELLKSLPKRDMGKSLIDGNLQMKYLNKEHQQ